MLKGADSSHVSICDTRKFQFYKDAMLRHSIDVKAWNSAKQHKKFKSLSWQCMQHPKTTLYTKRHYQNIQMLKSGTPRKNLQQYKSLLVCIHVIPKTIVEIQYIRRSHYNSRNTGVKTDQHSTKWHKYGQIYSIYLYVAFLDARKRIGNYTYQSKRKQFLK